MIVFPECKINLGLQVINKRPDGYHDLETVFYPLGWSDILEVLVDETAKEPFSISYSGLQIEGPKESNLIYKAWQLISDQKKIPSIKVHLHKNIPMGAGLGGGSSDAAYFINLLNGKFKLGYTEEQKIRISSQLGSDCAYFIKNRPLLARGKGDEFSEIALDLSLFYILAVYPGIHSNTKDAYDGLNPRKPLIGLEQILAGKHPGTWKDLLANDFEPSIFKKYPEILSLKEKLYDKGALYASLSGSGSAVFGIFDHQPFIEFPKTYMYFLQKPSGKIL